MGMKSQDALPFEHRAQGPSVPMSGDALADAVVAKCACPYTRQRSGDGCNLGGASVDTTGAGDTRSSARGTASISQATV